MPQTPLIFIIAGEASGDQLGANLMASLKHIQKVRFAGIGGKAMEDEGLKTLFPMENLSIIGILGILRQLKTLLGRLKLTIRTIQALKPDVVITIDAPEFSFRIMKQLYKEPHRPRLVHYVAPTVWAWRPGRARKISKFIDHLLCLYPFEPPYFEKYGLSSTFVGHPIAHEPFKKTKRDPNLLCVLPGSRRSEIETLLPVFKETVRLLKRDFPNLNVVLPTLPALAPFIHKETQGWPCNVQVVVGDDARKRAFEKASVALAASGTVALQLSAARLPFVIAYKIGKVSGAIARLLIKTPWVCMVNILLNRTCIPEFLQESCTPENLSSGISELLKNPRARKRQEEAMTKAISLLKAPSDRGAREIIKQIREVSLPASN